MKAASGNVTLDRRWVEFCAYLVIGAVLAFLFAVTLNMPPPFLPGYPGDSFFPQLVIGFTALWVVIGLISTACQLIRPPAGEAARVKLNVVEFLIAGLACLAYALLMPVVGFEIASVGLLGGLLLPRLGWRSPRSWIKALVYSVVTMLILYGSLILFLGVDFPVSLLPQYLGQ